MHNKKHKENTYLETSICKTRKNQLLVMAGMDGCTGETALIPVWFGFVWLLFKTVYSLFHLENWYHLPMKFVTLYYSEHSWTQASKQNRLIKIGRTQLKIFEWQLNNCCF